MPVQAGGRVDVKNMNLFFKTNTLTSGVPPLNPNTFLVVRLTEGAAQISHSNEYTEERDRGRLDGIMEGDEQQIELQIEARYTKGARHGSEPYTAHEIVFGKSLLNANFNAPIFSGTREPWRFLTNCDPYAFEIEIHDNPRLRCPDTNLVGEAMLFRYCRVYNEQFNMSNGNLTMTVRANITREIHQRLIFPYTKWQLGEPLTNWAADERSL